MILYLEVVALGEDLFAVLPGNIQLVPDRVEPFEQDVDLRRRVVVTVDQCLTVLLHRAEVFVATVDLGLEGRES